MLSHMFYFFKIQMSKNSVFADLIFGILDNKESILQARIFVSTNTIIKLSAFKNGVFVDE